MKFLIIIGTVRDSRKSIHVARQTVEAFKEKGHEAELFDPMDREIPYLGNRRYTEEGEVPEDIEEFGSKVESSEGIVIVTPEYNHSIPGVLKNLLDYLYPEYSGKPFSYVTVSAGGFGGVRALSHLHDITLGLNAIPGPDLQVSKVGEVFDSNGSLIEESYQDRFDDFVGESEDFVNKLK